MEQMARNVPGNDKQDAAYAQVGQEDVDPDVRSHGIEEREEAVLGGVGFAVQDADAHAHEGLGEVDHLLAHVGDGEGSHGHVCFLQRKSSEERHDEYMFCFCSALYSCFVHGDLLSECKNKVKELEMLPINDLCWFSG